MMFLHGSRRRARTAVLGAVSVTALLAAGCSGSGDGDSASETLVAYTGQATDYQINFNPYSPSLIDGPGTIFEPLFYFNLTGETDPVPRLATEYSWNDDGTELSITLRDDATWSDGERFTADDVVFTLDMVAGNPTMNNTGYAGRAEAVDDTHVTVAFDEPAFTEGPQVLGKLWIVPEHIWKDFDDPATNVVKEPVGTGPYVLDTFKPQAFTLAANPDYWDGEPAVEQVRFVSLSGNQAGADALAAGKIDWQTGPVPEIDKVEENYPGYRAITVPMNQVGLFTCSNAELGCTGPQTDPAVRQAIYHAIDRTQLNKLAFQGTASEISPGFALPERDAELVSDRLQNKIAPMDPEPAKAQQLLQDAGYRKGSDGIYAKDGRKLSLSVKVVSGWTDYITAVDTMVEQLKPVGIEITAQQVSWNEWSDARGQGEFQLLIDSLYQGPSPDPFYVYSYFFATETTAEVGETANPNFSRFSNPAVDQALSELKKISQDDLAARQPHYDTIQTEIERSLPYIPVLTGGTTSEYNAEKFSGWPTPDDMYAFPAVWSRPDHSQIFMNLKPAE